MTADHKEKPEFSRGENLFTKYYYNLCSLNIKITMKYFKKGSALMGFFTRYIFLFLQISNSNDVKFIIIN